MRAKAAAWAGCAYWAVRVQGGLRGRPRHRMAGRPARDVSLLATAREQPLEAHRRAAKAGKPAPSIVPIGLHYSDQHSFRERVSLQINRSMETPPLPQEEGAPLPSEEELKQYGEQAHDRVWCDSVTTLLQTELNRISHAQESWGLCCCTRCHCSPTNTGCSGIN